MNPNVARRRHEKATQAKQGRGRGRDGNSSQADGQGQQHVNVGVTERQFSMIGGTALAVYGLLRPSLAGLALAAIGGALIWRGHTGHCDMYEKLGYSSADEESEQGDGTEKHESHGQPMHHEESRAAG